MRQEHHTRGKRIRSLRQSRGMTQAALAEACGVNPSFISILENDRNTPSRNLILRLAAALRTSVEFLEEGKETQEERARTALAVIWPQLVYVISNDIVIPRFEKLLPELPPSGPLRQAIQEAWSSKHFCEFMQWAASPPGKSLGEEIANSPELERLVFLPKDPMHLDSATWIQYASPQKRDRRLAPGVDSQGHHAHKRSAMNVEIASSEGACYDFELEATAHLYSELRLGFFPCQVRDFSTRPFLSEFVDAAMPPVFWAAARAWSDRRLAGWFRYLGMPADLYGPLARLARQYQNPAIFLKAASRLWQSVQTADADAFLGTFCDFYGSPAVYFIGLGEKQAVGAGPVVDSGESFEPGTGSVWERRRLRETLHDRLLFDAVWASGDPALRAKLSAFLRRIAPPHVFDHEDVLRIIDHPHKRSKRARAEPYPETLP